MTGRIPGSPTSPFVGPASLSTFASFGIPSHTIISRSAFPCAILCRSASLMGRWSRKVRAFRQKEQNPVGPGRGSHCRSGESRTFRGSVLSKTARIFFSRDKRLFDQPEHILYCPLCRILSHAAVHPDCIKVIRNSDKEISHERKLMHHLSQEHGIKFCPACPGIDQ